ncbi:MAG: 4Fe-4S dicluster domain-containing protein [Planctomycetota bacterium]|jgi:Fe-S-cluster-containing dehydrogenase component
MQKKKGARERPGDGKPTRRDCLRMSAAGAGGALFLAACGGRIGALSLLEGGPGRNRGGYDPTKHEYVLLFDITKCIGCGACVRACERENDVPPDYFRTWVERYLVSRAGHVLVDSPDGGRDGFEPVVTGQETTKAFFVPKLCNHCKFTPCVQLCPVGASYRSPDGVILVDEKRCIGCGYCVQACPYGSRFIHPVEHVASKCTLCYHRITKGLRTACVETCPTGARSLGDRKDPDDEVSKLIATQATHVLKPELLTVPACHYVGMSEEVR